MDWNWATIWWIVAGLLVAAELATGTFYLLMLALGAGVGAVAAHLGMTPPLQALSAALLGGAAVFILYRRRTSAPVVASTVSNPAVNLDVGQSVQVEAWSPDGLTQVHYRGAPWQARFVGNAEARGGRHVIRGVDGNCLLLDR